MIQQLINAARGQFQGFANAPRDALTLPLQAVGAANMGQNTTTGQTSMTQNTTGTTVGSQNPGLLGTLGGLLSLF